MPAISTLPEIALDTPVTFFVGENGSGKSTVLEALAIATNLPAVASTSTRDDDTLKAQRTLASALRLAWTHRTRRGFFLRAEDFFGFAKSLSRMREELHQRMADLEVEYKDRSSHARGLAMGPAAASLSELEQRYGENLEPTHMARRSFSCFGAGLCRGDSTSSTNRKRRCRR